MAGTFSWKNVIKRTLQVCAGIVVVVLVAVGGVFAFVSTRKGQDFVVPRAVSFVNGTIVGKITLQQLRFSWSGRVEAKGMALYDLKGRRAVAVDALGVRISPAALLHHIISLSDLSVEGLAVDARKEADSWNIVDAVALRKPSPKTDTSSDLKIEIGDALLAASVLSVSVPENDILVRNVSMKFRGAYAPKEWNVDLSSLTLDLEKPLARHFATAIHANGDQDNIHAPEIVVSSPGIELAANGSFVLSTQATDFTISRLAVQPVFLAAIAQLEVHQSLMATAHAVGTLGKLKAALNLDAGKGGTVSVQASGNALNAGPFDVEADARKINITALLGGSPQPVLDAHIKLSQAGKDGAAIEIAQVTSPELSAKASGSIFKRGTGWHPILNASAVARAPVNGHAELKMDGSRFSVNSVVDVSKGLRTSFSTNGSYSADFSQINVSNIALGIPHSRWKSRGTAVLRLKPVLSVTGLDLSSGSQRIKADGRYGPTQ